MEAPMKLNIGCGTYLAPVPWTNVDRYPQRPRPADRNGSGEQFFCLNVVEGLPWPDGSCSHIYAGHVLEHLRYEDELPAALAEMKRLLAPDGTLCVVGPDIDRAIKDGYGAETIHGIWPGAQIPDVPGAMHQWRPTEKAHHDALVAAGFSAIPISIRQVEDIWPVVSRIGWQLAFHCVHDVSVAALAAETG
jgi:predicted SAM-dependent methyltransferase